MELEPPLDPDVPICDAHHHLWDNKTPKVPPYDQYLLPEFQEDIDASGHNIVNSVYVSCGQMYRRNGPDPLRPLGETEFAQGQAAQSASGQYGKAFVAAGIVAFADLLLGADVAPVLEGHIAASPSRFRGIRHSTTYSPDPRVKHEASRSGLLLDDVFRQGLDCLRRYDLLFDAWLYHTQLMELVNLARAFPDQVIVVNHVGGPLGIGPFEGHRDEVWSDWTRGIASLATCPNVVMKIGGFGLPLFGYPWHGLEKQPDSIGLAEAIGPSVRFCLEVFGADRCMFESNFPADKVSYSYGTMWNAFKRIVANASDREPRGAPP